MAHSDLVQSVARSLDILEHTARAAEGIPLQELAERLNLQPTTVYNLARTLLARGYLEKVGRPPRYRLGPALAALASQPRNQDLQRQAALQIEALYPHLGGATVTLAQASGGEILVRLRMAPEQPGILQRPPQHLLHPYGSAAALVFQAFWGDEERDAYRQRHPFWETGGHCWQSPERLEMFVQQIRQDGCAAFQLPGEGLFKVAVPVFGPQHELLATLGASIPAAQLPEARRAEFTAQVRAAAAQLASTTA